MSAWLLFAGSLLALLALAQIAGTPARSGPVDLVHPRPGHPVSLQQVEERSHRFPGGTSAVEVMKSKVYRDSSGRVRIDSEHPHVAGESSAPRSLLLDPSTGLRAVLLSNEKIAYRIFGPKAGENGFALGWAGIGEGLPSSHKWAIRTENLGKRTIDGIEFEGTRTIQTAKDEPGLTSTIERWYSGRLNLFGFAVATGPYGTHTARIENLHRGEPDPALFMIPPDYEIVDVPLPRLNEE